MQKDGGHGGLCFHPCKDNNSPLDCFSTLQLQKRAHCALFKYKCCVGRQGQRRSRTHNPQLPHNDAGCWDDRANLCVIYRSSGLKGRGFISRVQRERGRAAAFLGIRAQLQPKCFFFTMPCPRSSIRFMKANVILPVRVDQSCSVIPSSAPEMCRSVTNIWKWTSVAHVRSVLWLAGPSINLMARSDSFCINQPQRPQTH